MSSSSAARPAPVASGTLAGVPLAHALVYIRNKKLSGVLELRASAQRHAWLVFSRGQVLSGVTTPTIARFGTVVYEMGIVDAQTLDTSTVASAATKRPQMDILLEQGSISAEQRDSVLAEQVRRRVHHLFTFPAASTFTFREGRPSSTEPEIVVDVLAPVWRALCDGPPDASAAEVLARIGDHPLRMVSEAVIERAELKPEETALCEALAAAPMTVSKMKSVSKLAPTRVELLAYLLVITRCVEVEGAERAALPSGAMWAATHAPRSSAKHAAAGTAVTGQHATAAPGSDPAASGTAPTCSVPQHRHADRLAGSAQPLAPRGPLDVGADEIRRRAAGLATETPFATLGLAEGASAEAARAAYFRLARLWHPDRLPAELDEVRGAVERIFAHMTQAHRLLTDPAAPPALVARNSR